MKIIINENEIEIDGKKIILSEFLENKERTEDDETTVSINDDRIINIYYHTTPPPPASPSVPEDPNKIMMDAFALWSQKNAEKNKSLSQNEHPFPFFIREFCHLFTPPPLSPKYELLVPYLAVFLMILFFLLFLN